ncbi:MULTISPECIES: single-stranded DNA-binding protein [unclassified Microbacterium]|uniref:single-stranded DNA-binding protein n=1 Tax=unclassified Microbacterium TaxID=2609290 RepID=UPI00301A1AD4
MDMRSKTSVAGYLARTPQLKRLQNGLLLFVTQLGQKQYQREDDGTFTLTGTAYVGLTVLGDRAETAFELFAEGDDVVALGEFHSRTFERRGESVEQLQFRADKLLFDTSHPRYSVTRSPRPVDAAPTLPTSSLSAAVEFRAPTAMALGR